ncbi:hypothetical protein HMI55_005165 [Coelomomyces lativittatus]|nr:hypothetical protein HMI55_005165 [Coelomomyces lativittatus]
MMVFENKYNKKEKGYRSSFIARMKKKITIKKNFFFFISAAKKRKGGWIIITIIAIRMLVTKLSFSSIDTPIFSREKERESLKYISTSQKCMNIQFITVLFIDILFFIQNLQPFFFFFLYLLDL